MPIADFLDSVIKGEIDPRAFALSDAGVLPAEEGADAKAEKIYHAKIRVLNFLARAI